MKDAHDRAYEILAAIASRWISWPTCCLSAKRWKARRAVALLDNTWDEYLKHEDEIIAAKEAERPPRAPGGRASGRPELEGRAGRAGRPGSESAVPRACGGDGDDAPASAVVDVGRGACSDAPAPQAPDAERRRHRTMIWRCATYEFDTRMPIVMGILTRYPRLLLRRRPARRLRCRAGSCRAHGGGGSPHNRCGRRVRAAGAAPVSVDEELARVLPVVRRIGAARCVREHRYAPRRSCARVLGSGRGHRERRVRLPRPRHGGCGARQRIAGWLVMHMQGDPSTMQNAPSYDDVVADVREWLRDRAAALEAAGVAHDRICIDPGPASARRRRRRWSWCATSKSSCVWATQ